jgi:hypothetical protein
MSESDDFEYVTMEIEGGNESLLVDNLDYSIVVSTPPDAGVVMTMQQQISHMPCGMDCRV